MSLSLGPGKLSGLPAPRADTSPAATRPGWRASAPPPAGGNGGGSPRRTPRLVPPLNGQTHSEKMRLRRSAREQASRRPIDDGGVTAGGFGLASAHRLQPRPPPSAGPPERDAEDPDDGRDAEVVGKEEIQRHQEGEAAMRRKMVEFMQSLCPPEPGVGKGAIAQRNSPGDFNSVGLFCEVALNQLEEISAASADPVPLRIAVTSLVFGHLVHNLGKSQLSSLLGKIHANLRPGILVDPEADQWDIKAPENNPGEAALPSTMALSQILSRGKLITAEEVQNFLGSPLYIEMDRKQRAEVRRLTYRTDALSATMQKQTVIIERAMCTWQNIFLQRVFVAWRNWHREKRQNDYIKARRFHRFSAEMDAHRMELAFSRWRQVTIVESLRRLREREMHMQNQISTSKTHFSLQCFKADRYIATIEGLKEQLKGFEDSLGEEKEQLRAAHEALETQTVEQNRLWLGRVQRIAQHVDFCHEFCVQMMQTFYTGVGGKGIEITDILPHTWREDKPSPRKKKKRPEGSIERSNDAEEVLIRWSNAALRRSGLSDREVGNFTRDWSDGECFILLLNFVAPGKCSLRGLREPDPLKRAEIVLGDFAKLSVVGLVEPSDITEGVSDLIVILVGELFSKFCTGNFDSTGAKQAEIPSGIPTPSLLGLHELGGTKENEAPSSPLIPHAPGPRPTVSGGGGSKPGTPPRSEPRVRLSGTPMSTPMAPGTPTGPRPHSRDRSRGLTFSEPLDQDLRESSNPGTAGGGGAAAAQQGPPTPPGLPDEVVANFNSKALQHQLGIMQDHLDQVGAKFASLTKQQNMWSRIQEVCRDYVKFLLKKRAEGAPVLLADAQDYNRFTKVPKAQLKEMSYRYLGVWDEQIENLQRYLRMYYSDLRRIFLYYSTLNAQGKNMSYQEYWRFIRDCRIPDRTLTKALLDDIFQMANATTEESEELRGQEDVNPTSELVPNEWIECLIRMAEMKTINSKTGAPPNVPLSSRFQHFIQNVVIPRAGKSAVDKFRKEIYSSEIQLSIGKYLHDLQKVFQWYSRFDRRSRCVRTINLNEWILILRDGQFIDGQLSEAMAGQIFTNAQTDQDQSTDAGSEFVFTEFVEAVIALCVYRNPSPFQPLSKRLDIYLSTQFLPQVGMRMRIAGAQSGERLPTDVVIPP